MNLNQLNKNDLVAIIQMQDEFNEELQKVVKDIQLRTDVAAMMILDLNEETPIPVKDDGKPKINWLWLLTNGFKYIKLIIDLVNVIIKGTKNKYEPKSLIAKAYNNAATSKLPKKPNPADILASRAPKKKSTKSKGRK